MNAAEVHAASSVVTGIVMQRFLRSLMATRTVNGNLHHEVAQLEVQVHQLKRARQELADVIEVLTGVTVPAPSPAELVPPIEESVELPPAAGEDVAFD